MITEKISALAKLKAAAFEELQKVNDVRASEEYEQIGVEMERLAQQRLEMLPEQTKQVEYNDLKDLILEEMRKTGQYDYTGITAKFKTKKKVNASKVMEAIGGDFGIYQDLSEITQKTLKDFAATQPGMKKALMSCVEEISRELTDFTLDL